MKPPKKKAGQQRRPRRRLNALAAHLDRMAQQTDDPLVRRWLRRLARKGTFRGWTYYGDAGPAGEKDATL